MDSIHDAIKTVPVTTATVPGIVFDVAEMKDIHENSKVSDVAEMEDF